MHYAPLFAHPKILDSFEVNSLLIAKFVFSYHHHLLPSPFLHLFRTNGPIHIIIIMIPEPQHNIGTTFVEKISNGSTCFTTILLYLSNLK